MTGHALSFLALLPGFFIAALAAVATFQRTELDQLMPEPAPQLSMRTGGRDELVSLTLRIFLCHLFSYLTVLAFATIAFAIMGDLGSASAQYFIIELVPENHRPLAFKTLIFSFLIIFFWLFATLLVATMYGLYFLVERIHRPHY